MTNAESSEEVKSLGETESTLMISLLKATYSEDIEGLQT
jgi:hypothetical protein